MTPWRCFLVGALFCACAGSSKGQAPSPPPQSPPPAATAPPPASRRAHSGAGACSGRGSGCSPGCLLRRRHRDRCQPEALEALVSPIALFPDPLLGQVFEASLRPQEVADAAAFLKANPGLKDQALDSAIKGKPWDDSVKALAALPDVLRMLSDHTDWARDLGNAYRLQRDSVLFAVQQMRAAGDGGREPQVLLAADGEGGAGAGEQRIDQHHQHHLHRAGTAPGRLRAGLQPHRGVRHLGVPHVPAAAGLSARLRRGRGGDQLQHRVCHRLELLAVSTLSAVPAASAVPPASSTTWRLGTALRRLGGTRAEVPARRRPRVEAALSPASGWRRTPAPHGQRAACAAVGGRGRAEHATSAAVGGRGRAEHATCAAVRGERPRRAPIRLRRRRTAAVTAAGAARLRRNLRRAATEGWARLADARREQPGLVQPRREWTRWRRRAEALSDDDPWTHHARCPPPRGARPVLAKGAPTYPDPAAAIDALVAAARSGEAQAVVAALGERSRPFLVSGDPVSDRAALERFVELYDQSHKRRVAERATPHPAHRRRTPGPSPSRW